jgi:activator of 2-hydroxyglutaryl-CoA dehydratase
MVSEFNDVVVSGVDVSKDSKKAIILLEGGGLEAGWYKITDDNESSFLAMVAVFNAAIVGNKKVTVVFTGSFTGQGSTNKPIETVVMPG